MMMKTILVGLISLMVMATKTSNPVKLGIILMLFAFLIFNMIKEKSGMSWFSMIFLLLFMGGILVLFLIVSSTMPNEKMKNKKKVGTIMFATATAGGASMTFKSAQWLEPAAELSNLLTTKSNLLLLTTILVLYFGIFIVILSKKNTSMMSMAC